MSFLYASGITAAETCMSPYQLQSIIARGSTGVIWSACRDVYCSYAVKVMVLRPNSSSLPETIPQPNLLAPTVAEFEQEVNYSFIASILEAGPKVYAAWICS